MHGAVEEVYRRIRGNRVVEVRFTSNMDVGLSVLRSNPQTRDVVVEDHLATVELESDDQGVAKLLDELVANKVGLRSFGEKEPTLEDVFMMVTKGLVT